MEKKVARICWNTNDWKSASGHIGKSRSKETYEGVHNFGHEEWLFDLDKVIDGYHYGSLEPIFQNWDIYQNKTFDILLYTYNGSTKTLYWVGWLYNVKVITKDECERIAAEYRKRGWSHQMESQAIAAGAKIDEEDPPGSDFRIRFSPNNIKRVPNGLVAFKTISTFRYLLLQYDEAQHKVLCNE